MKLATNILTELSDLGAIDHSQIDTNYVYPGGQRVLNSKSLGNGFWVQVDFPVANNPYGANDSYAVKTQATKDAGFKDLAHNIPDEHDIEVINKLVDQIKNKELKKQIAKLKKSTKFPPDKTGEDLANVSKVGDVSKVKDINETFSELVKEVEV